MFELPGHHFGNLLSPAQSLVCTSLEFEINAPPPHPQVLGPRLEPSATALTFKHSCDDAAVGEFAVRVAVDIRRHAPMELRWRVRCERAGDVAG